MSGWAAVRIQARIVIFNYSFKSRTVLHDTLSCMILCVEQIHTKYCWIDSNFLKFSFEWEEKTREEKKTRKVKARECFSFPRAWESQKRFASAFPRHGNLRSALLAYDLYQVTFSILASSPRQQNRGNNLCLLFVFQEHHKLLVKQYLYTLLVAL